MVRTSSRWAVVVLGVVVGVVVQSCDSGDVRAADATSRPTADGVAIVSEGVLTRPDGSTVDIGVTTGEVAALADGRVVVSDYVDGDVTRPEVTVHESDGTVSATYAGGPEAVYLAPDAVAWVEPSGELQVLRSGTPEPLSLPAPPSRFPNLATFQGFTITGVSCAGALESCAVEVGYRRVPPSLEGRASGAATLVMTPAGPSVVDSPELLRDRSDVSADGSAWLAATITPRQRCIASYDVAAAVVDARYCGPLSSLHPEYSPDEQHVVTVQDFGVSAAVDVLDADLVYLRSIPVGAGEVITDHAWSADGSLVLAVMSIEPVGGSYSWRLLRQPIDGSEATVLACPVEGGDYDDPMWVVSEAAAER